MSSIPKNMLPRRDLSRRFTQNIYLVAVIFITATWALYTFNKTAPHTEGWYVVYANLILDGYIPYIDFEFLYPPLYAYLSTFIVLVFGNSLLAFRIVGVFLTISISVILFFIFSNIVPYWISAIGAMVTVFAFQGDVFFISYDYHAVFAFFMLLSLLFMIRFVNDSDKTIKANTIYPVLSGLTVSFALLLRPQSTVLLLFYFIFFILLMRSRIRIKIPSRRILLYVLGLITPVVILAVLLVHAGAFSKSISMIFLGGTKGNIFNMITSWIGHIGEDLILPSLVLVPFLVYGSLKNNKEYGVKNERFTNYTLYSLLTLCMLMIILSIVTPMSFTSAAYQFILNNLSFYWPTTFFILELVIIATIFFKLVVLDSDRDDSFPDNTRLFIGGFAVMFAVGAATSGPLCYVGTALTFGTVTVSVLYYISQIPKLKLRRGLFAISVAFIGLLLVTIVVPKADTPYQWWGTNTPAYSEAVYEIDVGYFNGIKMSYDEKYMYEDFQKNAEIYLGPDDALYCYANVPIFYTLAGKTPSVKSVVPWFDVSQKTTIEKDLEYLKSNNPKMIVFCDHTMNAVNIHELFYGGKDAHFELYSWLMECKNEGSVYETISTYVFGEYSTYLMVLKE